MGTPIRRSHALAQTLKVPTCSGRASGHFAGIASTCSGGTVVGWMRVAVTEAPLGEAEGESRWRRTLRAFEHRNFRLYFFGQLLSQVGTWMQSVAQAWLVLEIAPSPVALGTVTALQFLPITFGSFFASVVADRFPKRTVLLWTQGAALVQALLLTVLAATGRAELWHVYVLALALGCINAVEAPTRQAFVMDLVGREHLVNAVALNGAVHHGSRLVGPAVAGVAIAVWGVAVSFGLNALSFLAVLTALVLMRPSEMAVSQRPARRGPLLAELLEGLRFVRGERELAALGIALAGLGIFGFNYLTVVPLFATRGLGLSSAGFGVLSASVGVGALLASVVMAGAGRQSYGRAMLAAACFGLLLMASALAQGLPMAMLLVGAFGGSGTWFSQAANSLLQLRAPEALRGRVMGLYTTVVMGATPLGALLTSLLADMVGIRWTMIAWGGVCLLTTGLSVAYARGQGGRAAGR